MGERGKGADGGGKKGFKMLESSNCSSVKIETKHAEADIGYCGRRR